MEKTNKFKKYIATGLVSLGILGGLYTLNFKYHTKRASQFTEMKTLFIETKGLLKNIGKNLEGFSAQKANKDIENCVRSLDSRITSHKRRAYTIF